MSTRGCVAVGTTKVWRGVYNHSDSYPGSLGAEVYSVAQEQQLTGKLRVFCQKILNSHRWEHVVETDKTAAAMDVLTHETALPGLIEWVYVLDAGARKMHVLFGNIGPGPDFKRVCSIPFDCNAEINWLMIFNARENPEAFDPNKIYRIAKEPLLPRTSFERVLEDDDLV